MKTRLLLLIVLLGFVAGCRTTEAYNPFTHGRWKYSAVYKPLDYDRAWEIISSKMKEWEFEKADKKKGEIKTMWREVSQFNLKAEVRLDRVVDKTGVEGVKFGVRVLRKRPKDIKTPGRLKYDRWRWEDPDTFRQKALFLRFDNAIKEEIRKNTPDEEPAGKE